MASLIIGFENLNLPCKIQIDKKISGRTKQTIVDHTQFAATMTQICGSRLGLRSWSTEDYHDTNLWQ
jgi:hypothetical protein